VFFLQHGHGKSNKIEEVAATGYLGGVILSPGSEDAPALSATVARCRQLGTRVLMDPQSFIYATNPQGSARFHERHGLDLTDMSWAAPASSLVRHLRLVRSANINVGLEREFIAPAPYNANLIDYWVPTSLQYARTAADEWRGTSVLATLAVDESAFDDWARVSDWLDALTTLDLTGFYLIVNRTGQPYPPIGWEARRLANLLRTIYTLSVLNEYEVLWGYSDLDGILGTAVGADGVAAGWSYGLRQFSIRRYNETRAGGAQPVPRLYIRALMSDIRNNEINDILQTEYGRQLLEPELRGLRPDTLTNPAAQVQHLRALATEVGELESLVDYRDRIDLVQSRIGIALDHFSRLAETGLALEGRYVNRLRSYSEAIDAFRSDVSL